MPRQWCVLLTVIAATGCAGTGSRGHQAATPRPLERRLQAAANRQTPLENPQQKAAARLTEDAGNLSDARRQYSQYVTRYPQDAEGWHSLGQVCARLQKMDDADRYFLRAHELDPKNADILGDWGYLYQVRSKYSVAERYLAKAHELNPKDQRIVANLGISIGMQGRVDEAEKVFAKTFSEADTQYYLGQLYKSQGKTALAQASYRKALEISGDHKPSLAAMKKWEGTEKQHQPPVPPIEQDPMESTVVAQTDQVSGQVSEEEEQPQVAATTPAPATRGAIPFDDEDLGFTEIEPGTQLAANTTSVAGTMDEAIGLADRSIPALAQGVLGDPERVKQASNDESHLNLPPSPLARPNLLENYLSEATPPDLQATPVGLPGGLESPTPIESIPALNAEPLPLAGIDDDQFAARTETWLLKHRERIASRGHLTGFRGFCPVALRDERNLVDGNEQFRVEYEGQTYFCSSNEAVARFLLTPQDYVPQAGGIDPVTQSGTPQFGSLEHAVWYRGRLFLFSSAETLNAFRISPRAYVLAGNRASR